MMHISNEICLQKRSKKHKALLIQYRSCLVIKLFATAHTKCTIHAANTRAASLLAVQPVSLGSRATMHVAKIGQLRMKHSNAAQHRVWSPYFYSVVLP